MEGPTTSIPRFEVLVKERDRQGLTNADLADQTGLNESTISRTLRGRTRGQGALAKLARALDVPISAVNLETERTP